MGLVLSSGVAALKTVPFFVSMLYIMALGTGGIKPCVSTFGADQVSPPLPPLPSTALLAFQLPC